MLENLFLIISKMLFLALHLGSGSFLHPLGADEERRCFEDMAGGNRAAREKLIVHNLRLVAHIVKKYYTGSLTQDDLISIGTVGLIKAVDGYDFHSKTRFSTYAARCVENEILMHFRTMRRCARFRLAGELLDGDDRDGTLTLMDVVTDRYDMVYELEHAQELSQVRRLVDALTDERERTIIVLRYGLSDERPLTQYETAKRLGISRSYVSRIEKRALEKLRAGF